MLSSACIGAAVSEDGWIHACASLLRLQCAVVCQTAISTPVADEMLLAIQSKVRRFVCALALQHVPARKGREVSASHGRLVAEFTRPFSSRLVVARADSFARPSMLRRARRAVLRWAEGVLASAPRGGRTGHGVGLGRRAARAARHDSPCNVGCGCDGTPLGVPEYP